jgi:hypothetical protein
VKRARLTQSSLFQPKPKIPKYLYAPFLKNFVDPVLPSHRPVSVDTSVADWLESVGLDRDERCRSDSYIYLLEDPISRHTTRSAPEVGHTRDTDGFVVPPTSFSAEYHSHHVDMVTRSVAPSEVSSSRGSGRSSDKSFVEDAFYRDENLAANGIYMRYPNEEFPGYIASLVDQVGKERDSPGPSLDQLGQDVDLLALEMGAGELEVEDYFRGDIFPKSETSGVLKRSDKQMMAKHTVPTKSGKLKVSTPVPDMLYGYNRQGAFPQQQPQLILMGNDMNGAANNQGLMYPFFVIEFKGDGPGGTASLWVATNQCLGASASCVNTVDRLNRQLRHYKSDEIQIH